MCLKIWDSIEFKDEFRLLMGDLKVDFGIIEFLSSEVAKYDLSICGRNPFDFYRRN